MAQISSGLRGRAVPHSDPDPLASRLGGPLLTPKGTSIAVDEVGERLQQILLLNLATLPTLKGVALPKAGWLQLLIGCDDMFGCKYPSQQGQGFALIYHPEGTSFDITTQDYKPGQYPPWFSRDRSERDRIRITGRRLDFTPVLDTPTTAHHMLHDTLCGKGPRSAVMENALQELLTKLAEMRGRYDVMLGGHADFTQEDPRGSMPANYPAPPAMEYENLIGLSSTGGSMMWGDVGEATILVPAADLAPDGIGDAGFGEAEFRGAGKSDASTRLENARYYWDCC